MHASVLMQMDEIQLEDLVKASHSHGYLNSDVKQEYLTGTFPLISHRPEYSF